jgi:hypothetical protein
MRGRIDPCHIVTEGFIIGTRQSRDETGLANRKRRARNPCRDAGLALYIHFQRIGAGTRITGFLPRFALNNLPSNA